MDIIAFLLKFTGVFLRQSKVDTDVYFTAESYILLPYERYKNIILGKEIGEYLSMEDEIVVYTNQRLSSRLVEKLRSRHIEALYAVVLEALLDNVELYMAGINVPMSGVGMFASILASTMKAYLMEHNLTRMKRSVWFDYD